MRHTLLHNRTSRPPLILIPFATVGLAIFLIPLIGILSRTPWSRLGSLLTGPIVTEALRLSLISSITAAVIAVLIGVPLAWILARVEFPGRSLMRGLVMLPMVLPPWWVVRRCCTHSADAAWWAKPSMRRPVSCCRSPCGA